MLKTQFSSIKNYSENENHLLFYLSLLCIQLKHIFKNLQETKFQKLTFK